MFISVYCKICELKTVLKTEHEIVFVLLWTIAEQFHVRKSYKTCESALLCIGNVEENIYLSHIYLAVTDIIKVFFELK